MNTLEKMEGAIFNAIERTAIDADELALQNGRVYFTGDFDLKEVARAALGAMLEPSLHICSVGARATVEGISSEGAERAFRAMIQAALQEKT